MSDWPIREKSARTPRERSPFFRSCVWCGASFVALAGTGERGIWSECWKWYCSQECFDARKGGS